MFSTRRSRFWDLGISILFCCMALTLYLYRLTQITPGAWGDEIALGEMVEELSMRSSFTPFLTHNYGHPTPLIYLSWFFISIMGRSLVSLRIVSVIFGALSVGVFYLWARMYFSRTISLLGGILLATNYVQVIVTRFAYEMSAASFFLIFSLILLELYKRKKRTWMVILLGLSLGLGIYTYLAFRTVALVILVYTLTLMFQEKHAQLKNLGLLLLSFLMILIPLLFYSFKHPGELNARVKALSVFHQGLPQKEVIKEVQGAAYRTLTLFFFTPDPNPRQNPANTTPFDFLTTLLFFAGLAWLWCQKRERLILLVSLGLIILAAEIVTLEKIPEFHYYGLGHPNSLRISLLVPLVVGSALVALEFLLNRVKPKALGLGMVILVTTLISFINLNRYYNQKPNRWIYTTNFVVQLKVTEIINQQHPNTVYLSPQFYENIHINYFLHPSVKKKLLEKPLDCSLRTRPKGMVFVAAIDLSNCSPEQINSLAAQPSPNLFLLISPWRTLEAIVIKE